MSTEHCQQPQAQVLRVAKFLAAPAEQEELRLVYGVVLVPEELDLQGDIYSEAVIRECAHAYLVDVRSVGEQHGDLITTDKVCVVESYLAPIDFVLNGQSIKRGSWVLGVRVQDDDLWADVKSGAYTGFSVGGTALVTDLPAEGT